MTRAMNTKVVALICAAALLTGCQSVPPPAPATTARDFNAGPVWNQDDAQMKCPIVAAAVAGTWNGQWVTTEQGRMSVCGIEGARATPTAPAAEGRAFRAGPIWSNDDAQAKCPVVAAAVGGEWNGHWWTTAASEMSVCMIEGAQMQAPYRIGPMVVK